MLSAEKPEHRNYSNLQMFLHLFIKMSSLWCVSYTGANLVILECQGGLTNRFLVRFDTDWFRDRKLNRNFFAVEPFENFSQPGSEPKRIFGLINAEPD